MGTADEIAKLAALRDSGDITPEEFEIAKKQILDGATPSGAIRATVPPAKLSQPNTASPKSKNVKKRGCLVSVLAVIAIIIIVAALQGSSPSATFTVSAYNVLPLDGNTVRVYMIWHNTGKASGSDQCVMNTDVHNQFGDLANTEVNSVGTNGNVKPNAQQRIYQDIGVNSGDAQFITPGNITFVSC